MEPAQSREAIRERAKALLREAENLFVLADELYPLSEEEKVSRAIDVDDDAFYNFLIRVHQNIKENPGISANELVGAMGLPNSYPSSGSNYFAMQILNHLEDIGLVRCSRYSKEYEWFANEIPKRSPALHLVKK